MERFIILLQSLPTDALTALLYSATLGGLFLYVSRVRDHVREEMHIQESHEAKIKELIADELDTIGTDSVDVVRQILEARIETVLNCDLVDDAGKRSDCPGTNRINDLHRKLQLSRYMRILDHALDNKTYKKMSGWVRENGFIKTEGEALEQYVAMRGKQAHKSAQAYIEDRIREMCPDLAGIGEERLPLSKMINAWRTVVDFAKTEKKLADIEIRDYRRKNGLNIRRISGILKTVFRVF